MSDLSRYSSHSAADMHLTHETRSHAVAVPWFDGWRIVTGIPFVLFLVPSVALFNAGADYHGRAHHPPHRGGWSLQDRVICAVFWCEDPESKAVGYYVPGLYLLAASGSFALATMARRSSALRRISTCVGIVLSVVPALIVVLVVEFLWRFLMSG